MLFRVNRIRVKKNKTQYSIIFLLANADSPNLNL